MHDFLTATLIAKKMTTKIDKDAYATIISYLNPTDTNCFIDILSTKMLNDVEAWSWGIFTMRAATLEGMLRAVTEKRTQLGTKIAKTILAGTEDRRIHDIVIAMSALHISIHVNVVSIIHDRAKPLSVAETWARKYPFQLARVIKDREFASCVRRGLTTFFDLPCLWDLYMADGIRVDEVYSKHGIDIVSRRYNGKSIIHLSEITPDMFDGDTGTMINLVISPCDCLLMSSGSGKMMCRASFRVNRLTHYGQKRLLIHAICYQAMTRDLRDVVHEWHDTINMFPWDGRKNAYDDLISYMAFRQRNPADDDGYDEEDRVISTPYHGPYIYRFVDAFINDCGDSEEDTYERLGFTRRLARKRATRRVRWMDMDDE